MDSVDRFFRILASSGSRHATPKPSEALNPKPHPRRSRLSGPGLAVSFRLGFGRARGKLAVLCLPYTLPRVAQIQASRLPYCTGKLEQVLSLFIPSSEFLFGCKRLWLPSLAKMHMCSAPPPPKKKAETPTPCSSSKGAYFPDPSLPSAKG